MKKLLLLFLLFAVQAFAQPSDYWQQHVSYTISGTLIDSVHSFDGKLAVVYTNNSPDTLRFVWLQLDQNLYRPGSKGASLFNSESRWGVRGFRGGYDITGLQINGRGVAGSCGR